MRTLTAAFITFTPPPSGLNVATVPRPGGSHHRANAAGFTSHIFSSFKAISFLLRHFVKEFLPPHS